MIDPMLRHVWPSVPGCRFVEGHQLAEGEHVCSRCGLTDAEIGRYPGILCMARARIVPKMKRWLERGGTLRVLVIRDPSPIATSVPSAREH